MLKHRVPRGTIALLLSGFQMLSGAVTDSVYTKQLLVPDQLAASIVTPLPSIHHTGLQLWGWTDSRLDSSTLAGITEYLDSDTLDLPFLLEIDQALDILRRAPGLLEIKLRELEDWSEIDPVNRLITFYRDHDGTPMKLPSTIPLAWYIQNNVEYSWRQQLHRRLNRPLGTRDQDRTARRRTVELIGGEIAGQRVALNVTGNVAISGKVLFKDQQKSVTNFRANKNWELDINQTQRFDIEGTVGDRVSILVHQDSENDFEWENDMKIAYRGNEDDILKSIDAGNISLSLPGTQFATGGGGTSKGLFGLKAVSQLGPLNLTTIASIEQSRKSTLSNTLGDAFVLSDQNYLRGRYFFLDTQFRNNYYPLDTNYFQHSFNGNRVIGRLEVYRSSSYGSDTYRGTAYVDPRRPEWLSDRKAEAHFRRLELGVDYTFDAQLGWIRLASAANDREIISVAYSLGTQVGDSVIVTEVIGDIFEQADSTNITLKLIKDNGQTSTYPTWPLEFKNVYSLGGMNIRRAGFHVRIIDRNSTSGDGDRFTSGENYLRIFGLDQWDSNDNPNPDDTVDVGNPAIVNLIFGELHFPALLPFAYASKNTMVGQEDGYAITTAGLATSHPAIKEIYGYELEDQDKDFRFDRMVNGVERDYFPLNDQLDSTAIDGDGRDEDLNGNGKFDVPAIYYKPKDVNAKNTESRFDIEIQQTSRGANTFTLGFTWLPGSETVFINGTRLARDKDYSIDEISGTLTVFDATMSKYTNPEVTIEYEQNIMISFDKKVLMGTRAELDLGDNSFLGATGLYYKQSIVDERVAVGSEPIQNMMWDINGRFSRETPFITRLIDRLPLLETDAPSNFLIEGELAQVIPNPNPLGTAYIDDFEASKNITSPTLRYSIWQFAAPPVGVERHNHRKMAWWNPHGEWPVKEIWPQRETSVQASNRTTTILVLDTFFDRFGEPVTDELWGGITYQMYSSDYDQSKSKFFEIWLRGWYGELHVDVGTISEDINDNGKTDTEDQPAGGLEEGNGKLDTGEDIGLDGCSDETEDGLGGCLGIDDDGDGSLDEEIFNGVDDDGDGRIDEDISARADLANVSDPNGDNWINAGPGSGDFYNDNINGTEGNSGSPEGSYPDSEDLDGNGTSFLDRRNDYFNYSFRLEADHPDTALVAGATRKDNGSLTGWRMFRIPLPEFEAGPAMAPSWNDVKQLRIWVDGMSQAQSPDSLRQPSVTGRIQIAKIEFVGNDWEEIGISPENSDIVSDADSVTTLKVTVANSEDNDDYESPPGIEGEYDRLNDIRLREQSLVMDFSAGIEPGYKGIIRKSVRGNQKGSFLVYGSMDMFIFGRSYDGLMTSSSTSVWYFLRLGHDGQSDKYYYEIRKPVYTGWDDRNHVHIDMEALAKLKLEAPTKWAILDGDSIPKYELDGMEVLIRGDPSLERIKDYTVGVINKHPTQSIHGQIMMDELRLSNVRRDRGMAMRMRGSMKFADLVTTSINYTRKDADFHTIQQRVTSNPVTTETIQGDIRFNPDRFLPRAWGIKVPIGMKYSRNISSPKYYPGRDISASSIREAPREIQNRTEQIDFSTSFDKSSRSGSWLVRQTLDRIQVRTSVSRKLQSSDQLLRFTSQNIAGQVAYPIKFSEENYVEPFKKLEPIPWLGPKLKDTRFYYTPSSLDFSANFNENRSEKITRADSLNPELRYTLNLKRAIKAGYRVTDRLNTSYSWDGSSSMDHLRYQKLEAIRTLNTGYPILSNEQYSANFTPDIFTWFKPKLSYQARYTWNKNIPIEESEKRGRVSNQGRISSTVNLELKDFVEIFYTPESTSPSRGRSRRRNTKSTEKPEQKKLLEVQNTKVREILQKFHAALSKINPIALSYGYGRNTAEPAVIGQPSLAYRMGFETATGLPLDSTLSGQTSIRNNRDLSLRSGFNLGKSVNISLSHARKWSSTKASNATTESSTMDFLAFSDDQKVGLPFVNWSLRWSNLEKLPLLNKVPWRVSLDHSHNGSWSSKQQNGQVVTDTYKRQFQPLVGVTINFTNGISSNIRYSQGWSLTRSETGDSKSTSQQATATLSYQHRGGFHLPLPFMKDLDLENSVNFSMDFDLNKSIQEERKGEASKFSTTRESSRWGIKPYITYTFSTKVTGSLRMGYSETFDDINGRTIIRDFGFDVNIAIRG